MGKFYFGLIPLFFTLLRQASSEPPVLIVAENLVQVVTSSTLQWVAVTSMQKTNLHDAVIGSYQVMQDDSDEDNSAFEKTPRQAVYICRAKQNGLWVSGQLRPNNPRCITSLRGAVEHFDRYEVLINTEGAANLTWASRNKYTLNPQGAITGGDEPYRTFIARRKANSHNKEGSLTYFLGKFDPLDNLGKYTLVDQNDEQLEFEDGEILVETEPIEYELTGIKLDYGRKRTNQNSVVLGHVILKNEYGSSEVDKVDTVISYRYNYTIYWGHGHGLSTGLPLTVRLHNGTNLYGQWGVAESSEKLETHQIEGYLTPGTAVNVTLRANYGEWDTPYTAMVISKYKGGENMERFIKDNQREYTMRDAVPEFGPIYFLHNNSFVPTTTTTSTTTTTTRTTTTLKTTSTSTEDAIPLTPPEIFEMAVSKENIDMNEVGNMNDNERDNNNYMIGDDSGAQSLKNKDAKENKDGGNASSVTSSMAILIAAVVCARKLT